MCTVASRHYTARPDLYPQLLEAAKRAAGAALNGPKTIETCQAYLLLGVYMPPSRTFLEDRGFLFYGLAIRCVCVPPPLAPSLNLHISHRCHALRRLATELELHLPVTAPLVARSSRVAMHTRHLSTLSPQEEDERVLLSRGRVWLNCVCIDRSISTQLGKPSAIVIPGPAVRAVPFPLAEWWRSSVYNDPRDIHMCAYADLLLVVSWMAGLWFSFISCVDGVCRRRGSMMRCIRMRMVLMGRRR